MTYAKMIDRACERLPGVPREVVAQAASTWWQEDPEQPSNYYSREHVARLVERLR